MIAYKFKDISATCCQKYYLHVKNSKHGHTAGTSTHCFIQIGPFICEA